MDQVFTNVRQRVALLSWLPDRACLMAVIYQLGPARIVQVRYGHEIHYAMKLFYATAGHC
jgi:hypothetical protein